MSIGFHVYIDESGDEGFVFDRAGRGSSRWFVLSAVVTRKETDLETVKLVDAVRRQLGKKDRDPLHFRKLKHEHRLPYIGAIAQAKVRVASVLVHKPSLQEPEKFRAEAHLLYRYVTRYLLERVSWLCRDARREDGQTCKVIFSNRSCMSYDDMRSYLLKLQERTDDFGVRVDWTVVDPDAVEAHPHDRLMGLQIADAVASAFYQAVELSPLGYCEPRYAQMLRPVVYRHAGQYLGYGLKFWPRDADTCDEPHMVWLEEYGRRKK